MTNAKYVFVLARVEKIEKKSTLNQIKRERVTFARAIFELALICCRRACTHTHTLERVFIYKRIALLRKVRNIFSGKMLNQQKLSQQLNQSFNYLFKRRTFSSEDVKYLNFSVPSYCYFGSNDIYMPVLKRIKPNVCAKYTNLNRRLFQLASLRTRI